MFISFSSFGNVTLVYWNVIRMMALHLPRNMQPSCLTIAYGHLGYSVIALIPVLAYKDLLVTHTLKKITYI